MAAASSSIPSSHPDQIIYREFGFKLPDGAKISKTGEDFSKLSPSSSSPTQLLLNEDLRELFEPALQKARESKIPVNVISTFPRDLPNAKAATTPNPTLVQILSTRDATQPLRACGDLFEGEVPAGMTCTRNSATRLLRLIVTDGVTEMPAVELSTLSIFSKKLPIPGEKLLLKGAQVKNGMIIFEEDTVQCLGGRADGLFEEYKMMTLAIQNRNAIAHTDAPKFASLLAQVSNAPPPPSTAAGNSNNNRGRGAASAAAATNSAAMPQNNNNSKSGGRQQQQNNNNRKHQEINNSNVVANKQPQQNNNINSNAAPALAMPAPRQQQQSQNNNNNNSYQNQNNNNYSRGGNRGNNNNNNFVQEFAPPPPPPPQQQQQQQYNQNQFNNNNRNNNQQQRGGFNQNQNSNNNRQGHFDWSGGNNHHQQQQQRPLSSQQQQRLDARSLHQACNTGFEDLGY